MTISETRYEIMSVKMKADLNPRVSLNGPWRKRKLACKNYVRGCLMSIETPSFARW